MDRWRIHGQLSPRYRRLLTPFELLVPIVAVAFGYRAILGDEQRGELDVLETYHHSASTL